MEQTKWLTRMAMLVACATLLHTLERSLLAPFLWMRLGLANVVSLLALIIFGLKEALTITFLRSFLGNLIGGILFTPTFALGLCGAVAATLIMGLFYKYSIGLSLIGISILGAVTNNLVQLLMATFLITRHIGTLVYFPLLMIVALVGGFLNGLMITFLIRHLPKGVI